MVVWGLFFFKWHNMIDVIWHDSLRCQVSAEHFEKIFITVEIATCRFFFWLISCVVKQHLIDVREHVFRKCGYWNRCSWSSSVALSFITKHLRNIKQNLRDVSSTCPLSLIKRNSAMTGAAALILAIKHENPYTRVDCSLIKWWKGEAKS